MVEEFREGAFDTSTWTQRARGGYEKLGWVNAPGPLEKIIELAGLNGFETIVDVGTGSQAVLSVLAPYIRFGQVLGFDISAEMMRRNKDNQPGVSLFQADILSIPLPGDFADLVTARMVLHHIEDIPRALFEIKRILKPDGRFLVGEYVAVDPEVRAFERAVFDIKEKGRHLWTGPEFGELIKKHWGGQGKEARLDYGMLSQYSVRDWMAKSGLPTKQQAEVLGCYLEAPGSVIEKMNITLAEGDALVDRPFAYVLIEK